MSLLQWLYIYKRQEWPKKYTPTDSQRMVREKLFSATGWSQCKVEEKCMVALQKMWKRVEISYQCPCERNGMSRVCRKGSACRMQWPCNKMCIRDRMYADRIVLCGASAYEQKYYFNPDFDALPQQVKEELQILLSLIHICIRCHVGKIRLICLRSIFR